MTQGTTPRHTFTLPFDTANVKECQIIYAQNDVEIIRKSTEDCTLSGSEIAVELSQEDTLKFDSNANLQIQVRVLTTEGKALASRICRVSVYKCLNNEVIDDEV